MDQWSHQLVLFIPAVLYLRGDFQTPVQTRQEHEVHLARHSHPEESRQERHQPIFRCRRVYRRDPHQDSHDHWASLDVQAGTVHFHGDHRVKLRHNGSTADLDISGCPK